MINQVLGTAQRAHLSLAGVRLWFHKSQTPAEKPVHPCGYWRILKGSRPPCSPISHCSDQLLLVCYNKNYGLLRELPATRYKQNTLLTKPRWIPKCTNCNKLGQQQVVHIPHSLRAAKCARLCIPADQQIKLE
jgi:hypothetical protein